MNELKEFFENKQAQLEWANFINETMNNEVLTRVYKGQEITGYKQAREIIAASFKELSAIFEKKPKQRPKKDAE